jgi:hypothetical protein
MKTVVVRERQRYGKRNSKDNQSVGVCRGLTAISQRIPIT